MRLPRQDTRLSLSAEPPREALARDEAMLEAVAPGGSAHVRWYVASAPAVVVGLALRSRLAEALDLDRCRQAGIDVVERRAGGGAVLLDEHVLCAAVCVPLPHPAIGDDLTASYRWLGDVFVDALGGQGFDGVRRVEVAEAREDVARLRKAHSDPVSRGLLAACYGALSPHEVIRQGAKVVGLAQVRRRHAALFQVGVLLDDQSRLAEMLRVPDDAARQALRAALGQRTAGLQGLDPQRLMRDVNDALG